MTMPKAARGRVAAVAGAALFAGLWTTGAWAQAAGCGDLQTHLVERKTIAERMQATGGKKQIDAKVACTGFTQLVANGTTLLKWADANKDWCQIPDSFIASIKDDHTKAQAIKARACGFAARQQQLERQAKSGNGGQGGGLLGGGGLSGSSSMPQGAL